MSLTTLLANMPQVVITAMPTPPPAGCDVIYHNLQDNVSISETFKCELILELINEM